MQMDPWTSSHISRFDLCLLGFCTALQTAFQYLLHQTQPAEGIPREEEREDQDGRVRVALEAQMLLFTWFLCCPVWARAKPRLNSSAQVPSLALRAQLHIDSSTQNSEPLPQHPEAAHIFCTISQPLLMSCGQYKGSLMHLI